MMPMQIAAETVAPQAWRNGGGQTRELLTWPPDGPWQLRISRADITANGPFSAFPGVTRWFAVLQGKGVVLSLDSRRHTVVADGPALCFDGALAPECALCDGPTQDLNLMSIGGNAIMAPVQPGTPWSGPWAMRGLYTPVAGLWRDADQALSIGAHTLLWQPHADAGACSFTPAAGNHGQAWWLGFTPGE